MLWARMARALRAVVAGERAWLPNPCCRIADSAPENCPSTGCPVAMVGHEQREAAPRRINRRMLMVRNWRPQGSSFWRSASLQQIGRSLLGLYREVGLSDGSPDERRVLLKVEDEEGNVVLLRTGGVVA